MSGHKPEQPSDQDIRFRAAEHIADAPAIPGVQDSPEMRNIVSSILADVAIEVRRRRSLGEEVPDYENDSSAWISLLGGEAEARQKYGDEIVDIFLKSKEGEV